MADYRKFFADLRYGVRMLLRNPAFGVTAILILAVGIGANAAVFSIVDSILLKPLPYPDQERLMMVRDVGDRDTRTPMSYPEFLGWKDQNQIFESVGAYSFGSVDLTSPGEPQHFDIIRASRSFCRCWAQTCDRAAASRHRKNCARGLRRST
jgi:hypothetical protein